MDEYAPTSDEERTAFSTALEVRATVKHAVRKQYPYMKSDTLEKLLNENQDHLVRKLLEQESEHRQTKSRSSFFSLSAELRNRMYEIVLEDAPLLANPRELFTGNYHLDTATIHPREIYASRPALLEVNKEVRKETLPMYYASRPLYVYHGEWDSGPAARRYLQAIGPEQAGMIKTIKLQIDGVIDKEEYLRTRGLLDLGVEPGAWELLRIENSHFELDRKRSQSTTSKLIAHVVNKCGHNISEYISGSLSDSASRLPACAVCVVIALENRNITSSFELQLFRHRHQQQNMDDLAKAPGKGRGMASSAPDTRVAAARTILKQNLPMETDTLNMVLDEARSNFAQQPTEQIPTPEHRETKPRTTFLSLSGELRNSVYEMALDDHHKIAGHKRHYCIGGENTCPTRISDHRPALLRVSKQVRAEAMSMYYARPIYAWLPLFSPADRDAIVRKYLQAIGVEQAEMIKTFNLHLPKPYLFVDTYLARQGDRSEEIWRMLKRFLAKNELLGLGVKREAWQLQYDHSYVYRKTFPTFEDLVRDIEGTESFSDSE